MKLFIYKLLISLFLFYLFFELTVGARIDRITDKIANLAKALNKPVDPNGEYIDYKTLRKHYETQANQEVSQLQQRSKKARVQAIHGRSDLNPKWTFANLVEDSDDVIEAVSIAQSFIAAHDDPAWRQADCQSCRTITKPAK